MQEYALRNHSGRVIDKAGILFFAIVPPFKKLGSVTFLILPIGMWAHTFLRANKSRVGGFWGSIHPSCGLALSKILVSSYLRTSHSLTCNASETLVYVIGMI